MASTAILGSRVMLWAILGPAGLYALFLGLVAIPFVQRHALYAHKLNSLPWTDLNAPEQWGFAKNQVTPFSLKTHDGETLYVWHILPLPLYLKHEATIATQKPGFCSDITKTESFRLLITDPNAKLVLNFHGNAGHIAQNMRPASYHALTDTSSYHVLAVDYRGFGLSTGSPTEAGLIIDAAALVEWAMTVAGIPPSRIVLLGTSLGTAVTSGVAELYSERGVEFAGIVLVAGFSHLPSMLEGYRMGGLVPVLGPLRAWPTALRWVQGLIVDQWPSAQRLAAIVRRTHTRLRLCLVHARNDGDIPFTESEKLFCAAANATVPGGLDSATFKLRKHASTVDIGNGAFVTTWRAEPNIVIREEIFPYGGHNKIITFAPVAVAIMRSFDLDGTAYTASSFS